MRIREPRRGTPRGERAAGRRARHVAGIEAIIDTIVDERQDGDVVVIMSNGGFDGIHQKLVSRLRLAAATA